MPYKDPERKRQWEREHREQRNARRRTLRFSAVVTPKPVPDPVPNQPPPSGWKNILGLAVGVGIIVLGALAGAGVPGNFGSSAGSTNSSWPK